MIPTAKPVSWDAYPDEKFFRVRDAHCPACGWKPDMEVGWPIGSESFFRAGPQCFECKEPLLWEMDCEVKFEGGRWVPA